MFKYTQKLFSNFIISLVLIGVALANWQWPLYGWFGDTAVYRFIWLGIFFVILDIFIEVILYSAKEIRLITETMGFSKDVHKLSDGFHVATKVSLSNNLKADLVVVGSSGVWLIDVKDNDGKIEFNGDDLVQDGLVLKGFATKVLEKSYSLADFLKKKLNRDFRVAPVIAFSSPRANLDLVPKMVKGVYVSSRQNTVSLVENTDFQIIDKNTIEEIYGLIKNNKLIK